MTKWSFHIKYEKELKIKHNSNFENWFKKVNDMYKDFESIKKDGLESDNNDLEEFERLLFEIEVLKGWQNEINDLSDFQKNRIVNVMGIVNEFSDQI